MVGSKIYQRKRKIDLYANQELYLAHKFYMLIMNNKTFTEKYEDFSEIATFEQMVPLIVDINKALKSQSFIDKPRVFFMNPAKIQQLEELKTMITKMGGVLSDSYHDCSHVIVEVDCPNYSRNCIC
ncbi:hypothetical protein RF11_05033 [Thelohanellus kitauei]|uniref:BRCT domain-containing protein n=1 Tax=Thelohanellus kitauei TaxID=669202 RepID=A0A0C2N3I4_THEKT|nr:hypothetical protein RF11_05033 [Thelohanellus kitauei]